MTVGVPREIKDQEYRVSMTPGGVSRLVEAGQQVIVETGAGEGSGYSDSDYRNAGAVIVPAASDAWGAELVVKVKEPLPREYGFLRPDLVLFTYLHLAAERELTLEMVKRGVTGIAYETVELADGQLPLLKPMSEVAGRLAVQTGAFYLEKLHGGSGKLLGGVAGVEPARVTIIGGGIVGASAARVALGMGAEVTVLDMNIDKLRHLEEVLHERLITRSADPLSVEEAVAEADLLVGAVLVKGARTPRVVTRRMVARMAKGERRHRRLRRPGGVRRDDPPDEALGPDLFRRRHPALRGHQHARCRPQDKHCCPVQCHPSLCGQAGRSRDTGCACIESRPRKGRECPPRQRDVPGCRRGLRNRVQAAWVDRFGSFGMAAQCRGSWEISSKRRHSNHPES